MSSNSFNKIIYFDRETIKNILQEKDKGERINQTSVSTNAQGSVKISAENSSKISLNVPFISRVSFLFTGEMDASYIISRDSTTTISTTEISEFEKIKNDLTQIENVQVCDIKNSSTSLRVAAGYLRILKGGIDGLDTKEFKAVMESYDGYDTYQVSENQFVRFNNSAFVSNYKRNDLLTTTMDLYCISVGTFERERFDFIKEISEMERLVSSTDNATTLADRYPIKEQMTSEYYGNETEAQGKDKVELFDVLYACVSKKN